jgi:hypothetical protein
MVQINSTLKNKLRNYSILAGSALAAATTADGQIVYHDITPDKVIIKAKDSLLLDLNGDGKIDFNFQKEKQSGGTSIAFMGFDALNASIAGSLLSAASGNHIGRPYAISSGQKIGATGSWFNFSNVKTAGAGTRYYRPYLAAYLKPNDYGNWGTGDTLKFVGLRIKSGSDFNYGWARCTVAPGGKSMIIYDYAYQSTLDTAIIAGDTGGVAAGISYHQLQNVSVYSSGKNVFVKYPNAREGMTIIVTDLSGREVRTIQTTTELYEMNLSDASSGIYTITVRSKNAEMTKKVSIQ